MKEFFISECSQQENKVITSSFVVASKQVKAKKNGEPYLALTLWPTAPARSKPRCGTTSRSSSPPSSRTTFSRSRDSSTSTKSFSAHDSQAASHGRVGDRLHRLSPKTTKDIGELWRTLSGFVATFQNPHLKSLVELFMADPEIADRYRNAPAAKTLHHAYIGGLLDHVVSLFRSCDLICRNYPQVNRDLLLTGAFLHDIGKIQELTYNRAFSYTTRGQLLGHMIIELEMLQAKLRRCRIFPRN
jgi:3'-5' exoribonuclease